MAEVQETSNQLNKPGLYRHPESGAEAVVEQHPLYGSAMADAFVRVGYVLVDPEAKASKTTKAKASKEEDQ